MKYMILSLAVISIITLSSCNTIVGMGRDMRILGEGVEGKATNTLGGAAAAANSQTGGAPVY